MNTFVKFYRQLLDNDFLIRDNNAYLVFTKLLLRVNWKTGSMTTGRYKFSLLVNLKPTTAYAALRRLESNGMVTLVSDRVSTKITVLNWKKYQGNDNSDDNLMTTSRQADDTINKNKRIKEEKNITNVIEPKAQYGNVDVNTVIDKFEMTYKLKLTKVKQNRNAASNLVRKYGLDQTLKAIEAASMCLQDQYAPSIVNLIDLQEKYDKLRVYYARQTKQMEMIDADN